MKNIIYIYLFLYSSIGTAFSQPILTPQYLQKGIESGISEDYQQALEFFEQVKKEYPDHPAGYFFSAAIIQSQMMDFETKQWEKQFYKEINNAIKIASKAVHNEPENPHMLFFHGAAMSYKSFQLARDGKYIKAIKIALVAIDELEKVTEIDTLFCDAYLGVGSYNYWRSQITEKLSWLPFFPNNKNAGIELIKKAVDCSYYSKWAALSNLSWIYIQEENYTQAIYCAKEGLQQFPESRFFLWPLGDAFYKNKEYEKSIEIYQKLLLSVKSETINNHYNEILLHIKLAECFFNLKNSEFSKMHCEKALSLTPDKEVKKRANSKKDRAKELLKEISANNL